MEGVPGTFAFIIHPVNPKADVGRKYPLLGRVLTPRQIDFLCTFWPPVYISEIEGVRSIETGRAIRGWFIAVPYTPHRMLELPEQVVYRKIVEAGHLAERLGARILGLGAYTSVVGDAGLTIAQRLDIPVTNGDAYTVYMAVAAVREAARRMGTGDERQHGCGSWSDRGDRAGVRADAGPRSAGTDSGRASPRSRGRSARPVRGAAAQVRSSTDLSTIYSADLILTVTSATTAVIEPEHLKPGAIVCDVARPRDVSRRVAEVRDDVLVIEGGMVEVPGPVDFGFDFGFPPGKAYACMAETMALALEGRYEDFSVGKHITLAQVEEIAAIAARHGFRLSGFRSFERAVSDAQIAAVRERAQQAQRAPRFRHGSMKIV